MSHLFRNIAGLLLAVCVLASSGCGSLKMPTFPSVSSYMPEFLGGGAKEDESELVARYGPAPSTRIKQLAKLEETAASLPEHEQHRLGDELARQIQQETDPVVRKQVIQSMKNLRSPATDYILRAGLHGDKDVSVRVACAEALAQRGGESAVRELLAVVNHDKDIDVRLAAMRAIGDAGDPRVVPALAQAISPKEDPALQYRTAQVLGKLTGQSYGNDLVAWRQFVATGSAVPSKPAPSLAERATSWWR